MNPVNGSDRNSNLKEEIIYEKKNVQIGSTYATNQYYDDSI